MTPGCHRPATSRAQIGRMSSVLLWLAVWVLVSVPAAVLLGVALDESDRMVPRE